MSRIGNKAITIPAGVEVSIAAGNEVTMREGSRRLWLRRFHLDSLAEHLHGRPSDDERSNHHD